MSNITSRAILCALTSILIVLFCGSAAAQQHITGTFPDGATYVIDVPAKWNKKLLLYSHGYAAPGSPNPAYDYGDPYTAYFLFAEGYALAGSSYSTTGWAVHEAIPDQIAVLDVFQSVVGTPTETIAWGHSLGGMITAGLVQQYPNRFSGALPMCGVVAGGVGLWNEALDGPGHGARESANCIGRGLCGCARLDRSHFSGTVTHRLRNPGIQPV
jgi:pimeloyl-ACP methyl ester carboxylesterase